MQSHSSHQRPHGIALAIFTLVALGSASLPGISYAHDEPIDEATVSKLTTLSNQLIAAVGAYHRATGSQRNAAAAKLKTVARERRNLMLNNIERQPGLTWRQSLPAGLTVGLPDDVRELIEREVELTGRIVGLHGDDMIKQVSSRKYFLEIAAVPRPERLRLHAADLPDHPGHQHPAAIFAGKEVTIKGLQLDGQLLIPADGGIAAASLDGSGTTTTTTTVAASAVAGNQNALVLMADFKDKPLSCSPTQVNDLMFGVNNSVGGLYKETSYGAVTFSGSVYGPWQVPYNSTDTCDYHTWSSALDNIAIAQGINLSNYARRVYVFPNATCGAGVGSVGNTPSSAWIFYCGYADVYAHELGHNLGFQHAWTPGSEYGDYSSIMGIGGLPLRHFNAPNKVSAGWVPSSRVQNISTTGSYTIEPLAAVNPVGMQTLQLPKMDTSDSYFISLRQPIGYDSGLGSSYQNRISVHRGSSSNSTWPTTLLATLGVGESYSDTVNGYVFKPTSIGSASATVNVDVGALTCARQAPSVTISPISQSAAPGNSVTYWMNITNKNSAACGTSTFALTAEVPTGWGSSYTPFTVSLPSDPTAFTTVTWTVTLPATGLSEMGYPVYTTVYDTAATASATRVQGNAIVTTPDTVPPAVAITSPVNGANVSSSVTVAASASDNIGVARVEFRLNGSLMATDSAAPYSFKLNTRKLKGMQTIEARAVDAAGNAASSSIQVNATGGR